MSSLSSMEPLLEVLREVVGAAATIVEFVPHDVWLGSATEFARKVRNEEVENKVFLLENLSAVAEETGIRRNLQGSSGEGQGEESVETQVTVSRLPWATREGWAARVFADILPESLVQDALAQSCESTTLSTGLWPRAPQRIIGPSVEAELADFLETMQLSIRATAAEEEAAIAEMSKAVVVDEDGKETVPAPLLVVIGGGFEDREEGLIKKLELMIGLSRFVEHEKGGVRIFAGGEFACCILSGVLGIPMGTASVSHGALQAAVKEALLQVMRMGVSISLPLDVVCEVPEGEESPVEPQDGGSGVVVPLTAAWKQAASSPILLGASQRRECYISMDTEHGLLHLQSESDGPPQAGDHGDLVQDGHDVDEADEAAPAFSSGVPDAWTVKDIGPATLEQLRLLLKRSRGAIWNGSLGYHEDSRWQKGTQEFINMLEGRLTGVGEDEEDEDDEEEEDEEDEGSEEEDEAKPRKEPKAPKERSADFEVAAVLGRDSRQTLLDMAENPANVSFLSGTGEGLLQILRGGSLPGVLACMKAESKSS